MNLVLADILLHKTTKLQESSTGWHWSPLAPESPVREAGRGLGTCPGAAAAALGITIPRTAGTGADTTESGKREKPHGHRDPKVGSPVNAAQSPRYPRVSLETLTGERGGCPPGAEHRVQRSRGAPPAGTQACPGGWERPGHRGPSDRRCQPTSAAFKGKSLMSRPWAHV